MSDNDRPNVLMIVADDHRFDAIGALGNDEIETPHLDSLVESGCAFTRHHNMGSEHGAVCVPARSMIHSGRSLFNLKGPGGMTTEHPTLPERFGEAGYRTFGTGKWHNGIEAFNRCFDEGEDIFFSGMGNHWDLPVCARYPRDEYPEPVPTRTFDGVGSMFVGETTYDRYASGTHASELFADATREFIRSHGERTDDRPFFAYMATTAPHDPRTAPGEYHERYYGEVDLPENFQPEHPFDTGNLHGRDESLENHPRDPEKVRRHIADYYAMITHLDAQIGRVLDTLEATGERENTIVMFTADHGLAVGQHGLMGKQNLYDHSVRIPLVLAGPGVPAGERRDPLSVHYDLYPTLCELAGLNAPPTVEGESLVPTLSDAGHNHRESLFFAYSDLQRAVREDRFKLIEYDVDGERTTQLFDLASDPLEQHNLADDGTHAEDLERLRDRLRTAQERMDDPTRTDSQ
jgi:arylsulfatase A-like enzyme